MDRERIRRLADEDLGIPVPPYLFADSLELRGAAGDHRVPLRGQTDCRRRRAKRADGAARSGTSLGGMGGRVRKASREHPRHRRRFHHRLRLRGHVVDRAVDRPAFGQDHHPVLRRSATASSTATTWRAGSRSRWSRMRWPRRRRSRRVTGALADGQELAAVASSASSCSSRAMTSTSPRSVPPARHGPGHHGQPAALGVRDPRARDPGPASRRDAGLPRGLGSHLRSSR